jgi:hypothetical protein
MPPPEIIKRVHGQSHRLGVLRAAGLVGKPAQCVSAFAAVPRVPEHPEPEVMQPSHSSAMQLRMLRKT